MQHPFTIEYLTTSESFIAYCLGNDASVNAHWQQVEKEHPGYAYNFKAARQLVLALYGYGQAVEIEEQIGKLQLSMQATPAAVPALIPVKAARVLTMPWARIAVAVSLVLVATAGTYLLQRFRDVQYVTVQSTNGVVQKIELPDGSTVWLNAGGSLRYPEHFSQNRKVILTEGEAYFEVKKAPGDPFTVSTPSGINVQDIGTAFSVKSYAALKEESIGVVEGVVSVSNAKENTSTLKAGEGITADKHSGKLTRSAFSADAAAWVHGNIVLSDVSFGELKLVLQNTYQVKVVFSQPAMEHCRITTSFRHNDNITEILNALKVVYGVSYTITGDLVTLSGTPCSE